MKFGPLPVVPSVAKFTLWTQIAGGPLCQTSFFMKYSLGFTATDSLTLLGTLAGSWNTRLAPLTAPSYSLTRTSCNDLGSRTGVENFLPVVHAGTSAGAGASAATSFIMSAHVSLKYRGGHSRAYIPGISASNEVDQNSWSITAQGALNTAWTGMLGDLATSPPVGIGTLTQVAVRYFSSDKRDFNPVPSPWAPPYLLTNPMVLGINSWSPNPQFGSQRRRNQQ